MMSQRKRDFITRKYYEYTGTIDEFSVMVNWYAKLFWEV